MSESEIDPNAAMQQIYELEVKLAASAAREVKLRDRFIKMGRAAHDRSCSLLKHDYMYDCDCTLPKLLSSSSPAQDILREHPHHVLGDSYEYPAWVLAAAKAVKFHADSVGKCASEEAFAGMIFDYWENEVKPKP